MFQSALAVWESDLLSPSTAALPSALRGFQICYPGLDLVKSFEVPTTLAKGPTKDLEHELLEFGLVGNPTFPSRYAIFHRFSTLTIAFSFPCSKNSILEEM
ncbi:hypothetical protein AVEN_94068-1 [Araneus ventricosus]|uniref:Uncharacterized protein n=1 Tax=Araneus ventricosus TaxID=182803 RepID=A0A4Y2NVF6_ARAVE|nr:hypothetical protein AVEN_94068-1 [Araneus ventricosus]